MTPDPKAIADQLSEAQRNALLDATPDGSLGNYFIRRYRDAGGVGKSLHALGLTTIVWSGLMLNHIGLAVRRELEKRP